MVVLFGRVLDLTMKLEVVISASSGMASRELADDAMVIGSMDGRELISMKSCGSFISNIVVSLKYLVSLGNVDLVRDSLWNMGGEGGSFPRGPRDSLTTPVGIHSWQVLWIFHVVISSSLPTRGY